MRRHHFLLAVGVAIGLAAVLLWPRAAGQPEVVSPADRPPGPAAPPPPGEPLRIDGAKPAEAVADLTRGRDGIVPPELRAALEAKAGSENPTSPGPAVPPAPAAPPPGSEAAKPAAPSNQDPRMAAYRQGIKDSIAKIKPRIAECYASALKQDSTLAGSIKITFEIKAVDGGGRVVSGEVPGSELRSPFFEACVLEKVGGAEFPEPLEGGTVKVTYPFHFDPGGGWGGAPEKR